MKINRCDINMSNVIVTMVNHKNHGRHVIHNNKYNPKRYNYMKWNRNVGLDRIIDTRIPEVISIDYYL